MTVIRVIDLETTGLESTAKIVEWATFDLVLDEGIWLRGRVASSLVNPGIPIPPEASAIHHITDDDVKDAPTWVDQLKVITGPPTPDIWAAQNNRFDMQFFNPAGATWIDTYRCGLALWPECPNHNNQTMRYWLGLKLTDPALAPHRARVDCYVTAAILRRMLSGGAALGDLIACSAQPALLPRFTFGAHAMKPIAEVPTSYLEWIMSPKGITDNEDVRHTAFTALTERNAT